MASRVLWELKTLSDPVEREANDPRLSKLMQQSDSKGLQSYVKSILDKYKPANEKEDYRIQTWYVLDAAGGLANAAGEGRSNIGKYYNWRDYFREVLHHAKLAAKSRVHISRVFFSHGDQRPRLAFSCACVRRPGSQWRTSWHRRGDDHHSRGLGLGSAWWMEGALLSSLADGNRIHLGTRTHLAAPFRPISPPRRRPPCYPSSRSCSIPDTLINQEFSRSR